ncbi:hypothetical protein KJ577_06130 [bacterium]|nr:hypothetical protein [bacterium]
MRVRHILKNIRKNIKDFLRHPIASLGGKRYCSFPPVLSFDLRSDDFKKALLFFLDKLRKGEHFAFSRWGDGEMAILKGDAIDILKKEHGEFKYDPCDESDEFYRTKMTEAFTFKSANYFVGIGCPCCVGPDAFEWMKQSSRQDEAHLAWANLFVNANYEYFQKNFINGVFAERKVVLVCNDKAVPEKLPFISEKIFRVSRNSWKEDYALIDKIGRWIEENKIKGRVFLFCAGPLSNMLVHQLYSKNPENTYIDAGSVLDPFMGLGATRDYLRGGFTARKICTWDAELQKKKIFFCYGPAYGRKNMLKETVKYNAMYFPQAKIKIVANDRAVGRMKIRGVDVEIDKFARERDPRFSSLKALMLSLRMAVAEGDGDFIIFTHEDYRIQDISLLSKALMKIEEGYDMVFQESGDVKAEDRLDFDVLIISFSAASKIFSSLATVKPATGEHIEDYFTGLVKKNIADDKIFSIERRSVPGKSDELGFYRIPPQK